MLAAFLSTGCSTEPKGTEGKIVVNDTIVSGTAGVDTITLKDADLTADTVSVKVTSSADNVGIFLTLTGSSGIYKNALGFSTAQSTAGSVIQVSQNSLVTITYKDAKPAGNRTETFYWKAGTLAVALDNTSYRGIGSAAVITVTDPNISGQTATVNVMSTSYSTPFPVTLTQTSYGQYSGKVYFTVSTAITSTDTLHVKNGDSITVTYSDVVTSSVSMVAKAGWTAIQPITVQSGAASYSGLNGKMTINVVDSNVTTSSITVHLTSHKDPTGIDLTLSSASGVYSVQVGASLTTSGINVIAIQPPLDTMTISYTDPAIATPITGALVWQASAVAIVTDSASYNGFEQMMISATNDHTTAGTIVVNVSSAKAGDTIPITLTAVTATPWIFTGSVGFSPGVKTATAVGVKDSDMVTISFTDSIRGDMPGITVNWYSTQKPAMGLFGAGVTAGSTVVTGLNPVLLSWNGCTIDSLDSAGVNGTTKAVMITAVGATWDGFGWAQGGIGATTGIDMTAYAACSLHVWLKGNATDLGLLIENVNPGPESALQTWVSALASGYVADEAWHEVVIPISAWMGTCDLTNVSNLLGVRFNNPTYTAGQYVEIDDLYWTLPAATATPTAKKLAKKLAK